ncbi:hypothetical protein B0I35DRAFT_404190 [Stachybotrys elegans]|uniref:Nudix hydrolase domain-containing protein n=1 Tax=Stachybotrys elegans TaxID=80388 RepID=A0A8K0SZC6_9HYPO|nr:hypothetical protein B0I35DRAFT_404190 [Stachybotrys elegans]
MDSFWTVVERGNGFDGCTRNKIDLWKAGFQKVVDTTGADRESLAIILRPRRNPNGDLREACARAFEAMCTQLEDTFDGFSQWLKTGDDYHPIRGLQGPLRGLALPSPLRGILGIVTTGVHLNMYTIRKVRGEDKPYIWVSRRSASKQTYAGKLDQVVAGGMEPVDQLDPKKTLRREAMEEARLTIDIAARAVSQDGVMVGAIEAHSWISFYDLKDSSAGTEEGHLEPGIRYVFDLRVGPDFIPVPNDKDAIERFVAKPVDEVKRDLKNAMWKPNCGLVMLDFLLRRGQITPDEDVNFEKLHRGLHRQLPFNCEL